MLSQSINKNPQGPPLSTFLKPKYNRIQRIKNSVTTITKSVLDYFRPFLKNNKKLPDQSLDQSIGDDHNLQSIPKDKAAVMRQKKIKKKNFNIIKFADVSSDSQEQQVYTYKKQKKNASNQQQSPKQKQEGNQATKRRQKTKEKKVNGKSTQKQPKAKYYKQKIPFCQIIVQPSTTRVFKKTKISNDFQKKLNRNAISPKQHTKMKKGNISTQFKNVELSYSQQSSQSLNIQLQSEKYIDIQGDFDLRDQIMRNIYQKKFQVQDNEGNQVSNLSQTRKRVKLTDNINTLKKISIQKEKFYEQTVSNMNEIIKDCNNYSDKQKTIQQRYQAYERNAFQFKNSLVKLENKLLSLKTNIGSQNRTEKFQREYQPVKVIVKQNKINLNLQNILKVVRQTQLKPILPAEIAPQAPLIQENKEKQSSIQKLSFNNSFKQEPSINKSIFGSNNPPLFFNSTNKQEQKEKNIFGQKKELFQTSFLNPKNQYKQASDSVCSESGRILFAKSEPEKSPLFGLFNTSKKNQNPFNQISQQKKPQQKINSQVIDGKEKKNQQQKDQEKEKDKEKNKEKTDVEKVQQLKNPQVENKQPSKSQPQQKKNQPTTLKQNPFLKKPSGSLNIIDVIRNNTTNPLFGSSVSESSFPMTPIKPPSEDSKESDNDQFSRPIRPIEIILQGINQKATRQASQKIAQQQQQSSHDDQSSMFDQSQQSGSKNQPQSSSINQSPQHPSAIKLNPVIFNNATTTPANFFTQQTFLPQVDVNKSLQMFGQVQNQSANLWGASKDQFKKSSSSSSRSKKSKQQRVYN